MADSLEIIYGGILARALEGGHGLKMAEVEAVAPLVESGHESLTHMRATGDLGFFDIPSDRTWLPELTEASRHLRENFDNLIVLGIGGSALGITALVRALTPSFRPREGALRVQCLDNVDPVWVRDALDSFPLDRTAFVVISKSGSTPETLSQYLIVRELLTETFPEDWRDRVVLITDPAKGPLREDAARVGARSFAIPGNVGGRFSVMTPVGMVAAAAAGIDVVALLDGAKAMQERCDNPTLMENPGYFLGVLLWLADGRLGLRNHVLMPYRQGLWEIAFWFRQLWAESLGKSEEVGPTPIAALGATDQHSQMQLYMEGPRDKLVTFLEVADHGADVKIPEETPKALSHLAGSSLGELFDAELLGSRAALIEAGRPVLTIRMPRLDERSMGELLQLFMVATAMAGELYGVDAFNQPGVEAGKINAAALLGKKGLERQAARLREAASGLEEHRI